MATSQKGSTADQKVRSVSKRRYAKLQAEYDAELNSNVACEERIAELKIILQNRTVTLINKAGKEVITPLKAAQLIGLSKELWDKKQELLNSGNKLRRLSQSFKTASRTTRKATASKINQQRERMRLASEGQRNLDPIKSHVTDLFTKKLKSDAEVSALKVLATTNGRKFHLEFLKKLRKELKDTKIRDWVIASPKIQGELSRLVRALFGYKKA